VIRRRVPLLLVCAQTVAGCVTDADPIEGLATFRVEILAVDGQPPPDPASPLPANRGDHDDGWTFRIQAVDVAGADTTFDGYVRLSVTPGSVTSVESEGATGRNALLAGGAGEGIVYVTGTFGPVRLEVEDIGYLPNDVDPKCSNGLNDDPDEDNVTDFPGDPGCAFANDDTEVGGTFAAAVSPPVWYDLPRVIDIQGQGTSTPYKFEAVQVKTDGPQRLVVTRVSSDGFYATDLANQADGYNHIYAFNFSTPAGMRVCDVITRLTGTANEFFGGTQVSFPSFEVEFPIEGQGVCEVPEPALIEAATIADNVAMEKLESALVRVSGFHIAQNFGPDKAINNVFGPTQSNCDFNDDGQVDFEDPEEGSCSNVCAAAPECSDWIGFAARGNYKVTNGVAMIQINTGTVPEVDPPGSRGMEIALVTGTLRNFSGGSLNWTIETRCPDDLVCTFSEGCAGEVLSAQEACVRLRTEEDNDQGTN